MLVVAIRIPVRIVVLVLVVPVRVVWDALVVGRFALDTLLRPLGRAPPAWVGRVLFVLPVVGLWRYVLVPVGGALGRLGRVLVVVPAVWLHRSVLTPLGHGLALLGRCLLAVPARWLYTRALAPVGRVLAVVAREAGEAFTHAWRVAGRMSRAVGRGLGAVLRWILVEPVRRVYRSLLAPVGRLVRDAVLRPAAQGARAAGRAVRGAPAGARDTVRQVRADVRRALLGEPRQQVAVDRREPRGLAARSLGSSTTALTKD
ncbi:hypothetical protein ACIQB5_04675 [Streptomyces sp. NPDC088560]|uniref:hypothetical protein n=1 Tax=Streptomyces sp. NPDC088560 TaxID=3365868 RepID=UPI0038031A37